MLIDAHIHTSGISSCSKRTPANIIAQCIADKTDGIVLTNHCNINYTKDIGYRKWCEKYNEEYFLTKKLGDKYNIKVFFGIEVETTEIKKVHYVIYGMTPEDLMKSPELYLLNQKELFEYSVENGFSLVQAHPFRSGTVPQNPEFLHGVEINCHPIYKKTMSKEVTEFAKQNNLFLTCGSDFHGDSYKPRCGMYVPSNISNGVEFKEYISKNNTPLEIMEIINVSL